MLTAMIEDVVSATERLTNMNSDAQLLLVLLVFVGIPAVASYLLKLAREFGTHRPKADDSETFTYMFPRPSVTATVMLVHWPTGEFFVGFRPDHVDAFPGYACLPGGFLDAKVEGDPQRLGERVEQTAIRETLEETGITITECDLILLDVKSDPNTDPRAHVINVCYVVFVNDEQKAMALASDDLDGYDWRKLNDVDYERAYAFNHYEIIVKGKQKLTTLVAGGAR